MAAKKGGTPWNKGMTFHFKERPKAKGRKVWNTGLTNLTDDRVKKNSDLKKTGTVKRCFICKNEIYVPKNQLVRIKCCSRKCSKEYRIRFSSKEENNPNWKGRFAGYSAMHKWVESKKGSPDNCEECGVTGKRKYHWANIDHSYRRVLEDYIRMCVPCHRKYDIENNNYPPKWQRKD